MIDKVMRRVLSLPRGIPGYTGTARRIRSRSVAVLTYHGLVREPLPVFNWCQLPVDEFARQVEFLSQQYVVLPLGEVVDRLYRRAPLPRATACLTFDDGFKSAHTLALPVLQRYSVPASVFLVTSLPDTEQPAWPERFFDMVASTSRDEMLFGSCRWSLATPNDRAQSYVQIVEQLKTMRTEENDRSLAALAEQLGQRSVPSHSPFATLGWSEVDEMARGGLIEFGSHTHTHPILSRCSLQQQDQELRASRAILQQRLSKADLFAYPNGRRVDFTEETKALVREAGYRCGLCSLSGLHAVRDDMYEVHRVNIGADTTIDQFELRLLGL